MESGCLAYTALPHTSKLFRDLVTDFRRVARYYPHPPSGDEALRAAAASLDYPDERRAAIVEALARQNPGNPLLDVLSRPGAAAVLTGQQVGLFGGPAYSVYKALTAVKTARRLTWLGVPSVPVFWLATEDHDLAEVNHTWVFDAGLNPVLLEAGAAAAGRPVGGVELADPPLGALRAALREMPFGAEAADLVEAAYRPGRRMGEAFAELLKQTLGEYAVLTLDPLDPAIRSLAAPMLERAVRQAPALVGLLIERNRELAGSGYHAQVHVEPDSTLLFLLDRGRRRPLRFREGRFFAGEQEFTAEELAARAAALSPNALLRPLVQDFLLPTAAYIGGPAELAYFAQAETLYRALGARMPLIAPRAAFTLLDARAAKIAARYGVGLEDCFGGLETLKERIARTLTPPELAREFDAASAAAARTVDHLRGRILRFDPTLAEALDRSRAKILYQLSKIRRKMEREALRRDARAAAEAAHLYNLLYPRKQLQERVYCILPFLARHGLDLIGRVYENIRLDSAGHQVLAL